MAGGIASAVVELVTPLREAMRSPSALSLVLDELGYVVVVDDAVVASFDSLLGVAAEIDELISALESGDPWALSSAALDTSRAVFDAIATLSSLSSAQLSAWPEPLDDPETWIALAGRLPDYLLITWLRDHHPLAFSLLELVGGVAQDWPETGAVHERLDWDALGRFAATPTDQLISVYGWGGVLDHAWLLDRLLALADAADWQPRLRTIRPRLANAWWPGGVPFGVRELHLPIHAGPSVDGNAFELGLICLPVPNEVGDPVGMLITSELIGEVDAQVDLGDGWSLSFEAGADATGALGVLLEPQGVSLVSEAASLGAALRLTAAPTEPWVLLGRPDGTRLELAGIELGLRLAGTTAEPELRVEGGIAEGLRMVIDGGDTDSFLSDALGLPIELATDFELSWSSRDGVRFNGEVGFATSVTIGRTIGPVRVDWLDIGLSAGTEGMAAELTFTGGLEIGPLAVTVEDLGVLATLTPAANGEGDLGAVDLSFAVRPPTGLGIAIDVAGVVSGGGYLEIDHDQGRYFGILEVDVLAVGLTAIGILETRLPNDPDGWSMFLSLSATFKALQLGFGFTLDGVGGLIGINRGLDPDALAEGVRDGSLDAILFPEDPVADAPLILRQLEAVFPAVAGQYVFGPIATIGWGTPKLMQADVGVVIQLPEPLTVSVLGSFEAVLPTKELAILELHVDVAGTVNITEGTLKVDASLRNSRVAGLTLNGDMALRSSFLDDPTFLLSFGGFHPKFEPPDDFPKLDRLSVCLDTDSLFRIALAGYFAITSNTVQFGASIDIWAKAIGLTVEGGAAFDALIQFNPFGFLIGVEVYVNVSAGNFDIAGFWLDVDLEGPKPWHATGVATVKIAGIKKGFNVELTLGNKASEGPPQVEHVGDALLLALTDEDAWQAVLPKGAETPVVLADEDVDAAELAVHPTGSLEVRQRVAPLQRTLERFGSATLGDGEYFELANPQIGDVEADDVETIEDWFAPAQFFDMKRMEKLGSPSFERMPCGLRFGSEATEAGPESLSVLDYEQVLRDPELREDDQRLEPRRTLGQAALDRVVGRGLAAKARAPTKKESVFGLAPTRWVATKTQRGGIDTTLTPSEGVAWSLAREAARDQPRTRTLRPTWELE